MVQDGKIYVLDLAAKIDQTADYLCKTTWGNVSFPPPFGRDLIHEVYSRCDMVFISPHLIDFSSLCSCSHVYTLFFFYAWGNVFLNLLIIVICFSIGAIHCRFGC